MTYACATCSALDDSWCCKTCHDIATDHGCDACPDDHCNATGKPWCINEEDQ